MNTYFTITHPLLNIPYLQAELKNSRIASYNTREAMIEKETIPVSVDKSLTKQGISKKIEPNRKLDLLT